MNNFYKKSILITMLMGMLYVTNGLSQATGSNNYFSNKYLGWNNSNGTNPLLFRTNLTARMKLNGNVGYFIDGYNGSRNGNLLLAVPGSSLLYANNKGAYSMLHIDGPGGLVQEGGYRPWMKTGITFTGNRDLSYIGIRQIGTSTDITETTITWSDNSGGIPPGPDDMAFRFTGSGNGSTSIDDDLTSVNVVTPESSAVGVTYS